MKVIITCSVCKKPDELCWNQQTIDALKKYNLCFNCNFWREHMEHDKTTHKDNHVIVGGSHFIAYESNYDKPQWNGFAGRKFKVKFKDGRVIETNNMWHQGTIPPEWIKHFPDNAEFVS